jgi:LysM repeat protein
MQWICNKFDGTLLASISSNRQNDFYIRKHPFFIRRCSMISKNLIRLVLLTAVVFASLAFTPVAFASSSACGGNYTVSSGDTLRKIAARCDTTVSALLLANPQIYNADRIYTGQVLVMPGAVFHDGNGYDIYIVARGDTLKGVAALFGTTMDTLLKLNPNISNANLIYEGQRLTVSSAANPNPIPNPQPGGQGYVVQRGDTLRKIADRLGTSVNAILKVNPQITNANWIYAGQIITLPAGISTYVVQYGDTLKIIAARYGTTYENLLALNPQITNPNLIYVGQVIKIK